jgi:hypothetical protein
MLDQERGNLLGEMCRLGILRSKVDDPKTQQAEKEPDSN